jgi:hypothetical protein
MLAIVSTIAFLVMIVAWAAMEPARAQMARMSRTATKGQQLRTQSAQS